MEDKSFSYTELKNTFYGEPLEIVVVSRWLRLANALIDVIGMIVLGMLIGLIVGFGEPKINQFTEYLINIILSLIYYIFLEAYYGRTLGKLITGTKVVNEHGEKASFKQILGRSLARHIPFEALSFFRDSKRGWHDTLSKTYVTKCR